MTLSTHAIRITITLLGFVGLEVSEETLVQVASALFIIYGFGEMIVAQMRRPDTKFFFFKE
jgi:hypothetical protein